ncbi:hypothetical protein GOV05_00005 [Candidatus Woesearchaeota archaeon]|nr:hypothetical protein [Candidatus Woesearchaeota archaeon]
MRIKTKTLKYTLIYLILYGGLIYLLSYDNLITDYKIPLLIGVALYASFIITKKIIFGGKNKDGNSDSDEVMDDAWEPPFVSSEDLGVKIDSLPSKKEIMDNTSTCTICNNSFTQFSDKFFCSYCNKVHCTKHRIPEDHKCTGNPKSPPKTHRESSSRGGRVVTGK